MAQSGELELKEACSSSGPELSHNSNKSRAGKKSRRMKSLAFGELFPSRPVLDAAAAAAAAKRGIDEAGEDRCVQVLLILSRHQGGRDW
jgi:hypothetical protein